jgi:HPt (histidine-containing phosphotransfer) domain-containing protein
MSNPVDLTNLHEMTDNDSVMEKELFKEFISSFDSAIEIMRKSCDESSSETWRSQAHALKGTSVNLGANRLADLCKKAQEQYESTTENKNNLLNDIEAEYKLVREFLLKQ